MGIPLKLPLEEMAMAFKTPIPGASGKVILD